MGTILCRFETKAVGTALATLDPHRVKDRLIGAAMTVLAVFIIGFAIALSGYFAHSAMLSNAPGFDSGTVLASGVFFAVLLLALSGPVLLARAITIRADKAVPVWRLGLGYSLALAWAGLIGLAATGLGAGIAGV